MGVTNDAYIHYGAVFSGADLIPAVRKLAPAAFKKELEDTCAEEAISYILCKHNKTADKLGIGCVSMADPYYETSDENCDYLVYLSHTGGNSSWGHDILKDSAMTVSDEDKVHLQEVWKKLKLDKKAKTGWILFGRRG